MRSGEIIVVRGGGDLATGVIQKFHRGGFPLLVLETGKPLAIRRSVSVCEAVYAGYAQVEDIACELIPAPSEMGNALSRGRVPVLVDPLGECISALRPAAVIDAIMAKRNIGMSKRMAPVTIALGPGFTAGEDVDAVIETMRGHDLGRLILKGSALPDTGVPGEIEGFSDRRVVRAPAAGEIKHIRRIGDVVESGEAICEVSGVSVPATIAGRLRGLIHESCPIAAGMKIADIDPRAGIDWRTISDKARCLGGAALEAYLYLSRIPGKTQTCEGTQT